MKKIDKIRKEEERRKIEFVKRMEYEKHKRGITKKKEDYEEVKARKYVRDINEMYSVISPEKHLEITEGTKREGKKHCNTKSQWKYKREELEKEGKVKPEIEEVKENMTEYKEKHKKKILSPRKKEKIMMVISKKVFVVELEISPSEEEFETEYRKENVKLKRFYPEEEEIYETKFGEMTGKSLLEISIKIGVKIYEMI